MPGMGAMNEDMHRNAAQRLENMDDNQLDFMVNMMKSNPDMIKAQYEANLGRKLSDTEFQNMMAMMNP